MNLRVRTVFLLPILGALSLSAVRAQEAALSENASRAVARAERFIAGREYRQAAAEFERAAELSGGTCPQCLLGVARAYSGAGELVPAVQVTRMAIPMLGSDPARQAQAYVQLGALLARKDGDSEASREAFRRAVELDGRMAAQVRSRLAQALLERASAVVAVANPGAS